MPFLYTYIRFGKKCINVLPQEYKTIVENNLNYFYYGTLGPSILYYHSPITNKKYKDKADAIYSNPIAPTLKQIKENFIKNKNRDEILAYSLGYISHFVISTYINPYLTKSSNSLNIKNIELKNEIEKYYLNKDSININSLLKTINKDYNNLSVLSQILNENTNTIKQSLSNMSQYSYILYTNNKTILSALKLIKKNDLINNFIYLDNTKAVPQILRCEKYFEIAIYHFQLLFNNFIGFIYNDNQLDEYFFNSFNGNQKDIPIFNLEEEKTYIINDLFK